MMSDDRDANERDCGGAVAVPCHGSDEHRQG